MDNQVSHCRSISRMLCSLWVYIWRYWTTNCLHASRLSQNSYCTVPLNCLYDYHLHQFLCYLQILFVMILCFYDKRQKVKNMPPQDLRRNDALDSNFHFDTLVVVVCAMLNFYQYNIRLNCFTEASSAQSLSAGIRITNFSKNKNQIEKMNSKDQLSINFQLLNQNLVMAIGFHSELC